MNDFKHSRERAVWLALAGVAGLVLVFIVRPGNRLTTFKKSGIVWNTEYNITYSADRLLDDSIAAVFRKVELSVSPFNKASLVTAVNENRSDSTDSYLAQLYNASRQIAEESGGAFDPTVSPLINAWGFGYRHDQLPDSAAVDSLRQIVGIGKTALKGGRLTKSDPHITFNFSAIAKGFGCDEVARMLERNGAENFMVEIGGEITVKGRNPQGKKWQISIDKPLASPDRTVVHESAEIIALTDCGVATSGNYRNFKTDSAGNRYTHIIDPTTGYPAKSDILSATVVAPDCMTADAYATAFMVLGTEKTKKLLEKHPELSVMLVTAGKDGEFALWHSPSYGKLLVESRPAQ